MSTETVNRPGSLPDLAAGRSRLTVHPFLPSLYLVKSQRRIVGSNATTHTSTNNETRNDQMGLAFGQIIQIRADHMSLRTRSTVTNKSSFVRVSVLFVSGIEQVQAVSQA
jgi:hypothetical protein